MIKVFALLGNAFEYGNSLIIISEDPSYPTSNPAYKCINNKGKTIGFIIDKDDNPKKPNYKFQRYYELYEDNKLKARRMTKDEKGCIDIICDRINNNNISLYDIVRRI